MDLSSHSRSMVITNGPCGSLLSVLKVADMRMRILDEARTPLSCLSSHAKLVGIYYLEKCGDREPPPAFKEGQRADRYFGTFVTV